MMTARHEASPFQLLRMALGGPRQLMGKFQRLQETAALQISPGELQRRLTQLQARGLCGRAPSRLQLTLGGIDLLRFFIVPGAKDFYELQGIDFRFHQVLRFLDDPVSLVDPVGLFSQRDVIIGHLMQVVHLDPVYDLQLLQMFHDGLDELESQLVAMADGTHPRAKTIGAIIEDPSYHARLLDYVRRFRVDPNTPTMKRPDGGLRKDPWFRLAEAQMATLPAFLRYAARLPTSGIAFVRHVEAGHIPADLCDPDVVSRWTAEAQAA
jgi:hypothetical protein